MKIKVASTNPQKIQAIKDLISEYPVLNGAIVESVSVSSGASEQPMTLEETILGAEGRARNAFQDCDLSFGMENGLIPIPTKDSGFMDMCVCVIYDGRDFKQGFSSGLHIPKRMIDLIDGDTDLSAACRKAGFTTEEKIGNNHGVVGLLSNNRVDRAEQLKQAIISAMIHLENEELFKQ